MKYKKLVEVIDISPNYTFVVGTVGKGKINENLFTRDSDRMPDINIDGFNLTRD